jgi:two-component system, cell cycle sensor histidine kinase and response regulator CckA
MNNIAGQNSNRILIIDDNQAIHDDFRKILGNVQESVTDISAAEAALFGDEISTFEKPEYDLGFASQGEEGLHKVEQALAEGQPFALAFVDVRMPPGWDGIETVSRIWKVAPDLQIVICTAYSDYSWEEMIRKLGNTDQLLILKKPFDTTEVHQMASAMVQKYSLQLLQRSSMRTMENQMAGNVEEVHRSLALTQATLDATADGILVIDKAGKITGFNRKFLAIWNLPPSLIESRHYESMINAVLWQVVAPEGFKAKFKELSEEFESDSHDLVEFVDGRVFERFSQPQQIDGKAAGRVWSFHDITEQRQAELKIREQASLLNLATDAIFVCDMEHRVTFWNRGCEALFGWESHEVMGRPVTSFLYVELEQLKESLGTLKDNGGWDGETMLLTRDGTRITVSSRLTLVRGKNEEPKSVLAINTDISERKEMEARLLRTQRMECIGTMASGVAHDLNNILSPVMIAVPMLRDALTGEDGQGLLNNIEVSAKRGAEIVKQLLAFGRGVEGEKSVVPLAHMVNEIGKIIGETFPKDIAIRTRLEQELWPVVGDSTHVHQVLLNLCINARDAMPDGGEITISVENVEVGPDFPRQDSAALDGSYVKLQVADTGAGIPQSILEKIFDPFFTTKEQGQGTGLGLSTVLGIVRSHGGFINVESSVDKGTSFSAFLPATKEARGEVTVDDRRLQQGGGETILLVDDEEGVLKTTARLLEANGYLPLIGSDGIEGLTVYAEHKDRIDVVLTDIMMPNMDGAEMMAKLLEQDSDLRVIASSGLETDERFDQMKQMGIRGFLQKPYTAQSMLAVLREVLDGKSAAK